MDSFSMGSDDDRFDCTGRVTAGHSTFFGASETDRVFLPNSIYIKSWKTFVVLTILLSCSAEIYQLTISSIYYRQWFIIYIGDFVFICDVILTFYTAYTDPLNAAVVHDRRRVTCNYLMTTFIPDCVSLIPTELFAFAINKPVLQSMALLRVNKLIRFYRIITYFDSHEAKLGAKVGLIKGIKYAIVCLFTIHTLTCIWYSMACPGYHYSIEMINQCRENTWASADSAISMGADYQFSMNHLTVGNYTLQITTSDAYIASMYWVIATATATGFGDISAKNIGEEVISVLVMLVGIGLFVGMTLGGMASMLTNWDQQRANYLHKFNIINQYLVETECEDDLKEQVVGYYEYLWIRRRGEPVLDIYKSLPVTFVAEISYATYKPILDKAHLFDELEPGFLRMLSLLIHPVLFLPQQIVVARGDLGEQMFFIHKGEVEVLSEEDDETPVATLKSGKLFGELNVVLSLPRTATVRAITHCDLMCLERTDLQGLLKQYPEIQKKLIRYAHQRMDNVGQIFAQKNGTNTHKAWQRKKYGFVEPSKLGDIRRSAFSLSQTSSSTLGHTDNHLLTVPHMHQNSHNREFHQSPSPLATPSSILSSYHQHSHPSFFQHRDHHTSHISIGSSMDALTDIDSNEEVQVVSVTCCQTLKFKMGKCVDWFNSITIDPNSVLRQIWQNFIMFITVVLCIVYPYMAGFTAYDQRKGYMDTIFGKIVLGVTFICDFILVLDVFVNLRTGIATPHGTLTDFKDIVNHYCKSKHFVNDVLCILPLGLLSRLIEDTSIRSRVYPFLKLNKLIKAFDLPIEFSKKEERMEGSILLMRSLKLLLYIFLLTHWVTCMLYVVVCYGAECNEGSWIKVWANHHQSSVGDMKPYSEYITALYWATATMTSTGYGDISAHTTFGRLMSLTAMLVGFFLYGYCLSVLAATLANIDGARVRFQEKIFALKDFMHNRHLGTELQDRVTKYWEIMWYKYGGEWMPGTKQLLHEIPLALRQDIALEDTYWMLMKCPVFSDLDPTFLRKLSVTLVTYTFAPGDIIVYAGDLGKEMYMIKKGVCQYISPKHDLVLTELSIGDYFGDLPMLLGDYQMANVRAKTHVEVLEIRKKEFDVCLKEFSVIEAQFKHIMDDRDLYLSVRAKLNQKLSQAEETLLAEQEDISDKNQKGPDTENKQSPSTQQTKPKNTKVFKKSKGSEHWEDYMQPFQELHPCCRLLARLLLLKHTYLPEGYVMKAWVRVRVTIAVLLAITVPLQAAFLYKNGAIWVVHYFIDIIGFVNLYLGLHMAYLNDEGTLVTHPVVTAKQYLTTGFAVDLLGCFPFETIAFIIDPQLSYETLHAAALIYLLRLLQIYRLPLQFSSYESCVHQNVENIKEFKFILYILIFLNAVTCVLFMMACPPTQALNFLGEKDTFKAQEHRCIVGSWVQDPDIKFNITEAGFITLYTLSGYWATATAISVGYGEISAASDVEMVITLIIMILGVLFFGYIVASIAASLANADAQRANYKDKMNCIKRYMKDQEIWTPLQKKTIAYFEYIWQRTLGVDPETLFDGLPLSLWEDVTCSMYQESLSKISWFKGSDRSFLKTLSRYIKPVIFRSGNYIVRKSDVGSEVYFIFRGIVDVVSDDGFEVFESLTQGQSFGEDAWLFSSPCSSTVRARTNCDLFILTKQDLDFVLESYPKLRNKITKIAKAEHSRARKMQESDSMQRKAKMAAERRLSSQMYKSVKWDDIKLVDPESRGLEVEGISEKRPSIGYKAKPRHSIAAGAFDEEGAEVNLPPGLRDFHKRLSMQPSETVMEEEDDDDTYEEISAITIPAITIPTIMVNEPIQEEEEMADSDSSCEVLPLITLPRTVPTDIEGGNNDDDLHVKDGKQDSQNSINVNNESTVKGSLTSKHTEVTESATEITKTDSETSNKSNTMESNTKIQLARSLLNRHEESCDLKENNTESLEMKTFHSTGPKSKCHFKENDKQHMSVIGSKVETNSRECMVINVAPQSECLEPVTKQTINTSSIDDAQRNISQSHKSSSLLNGNQINSGEQNADHENHQITSLKSTNRCSLKSINTDVTSETNEQSQADLSSADSQVYAGNSIIDINTECTADTNTTQCSNETYNNNTTNLWRLALSKQSSPGVSIKGRSHRSRAEVTESFNGRSSNLSLTSEQDYGGNSRRTSAFSEPESDISLVQSEASLCEAGYQIPLDLLIPVKGGLLCRLKKLTIHPSSNFYWFYSLFMCLMGFISGWLIIYQVAFQDHHTVVLAFNYIIDFFYIIEIFVKFRLCYFDESGDLVKDTKMVAKNYFKGQGFNGFFLDIIAALPIEVLAFSSKPGYKMLVLSILRLLRLLRLIRVTQYFNKWEQELNINMLFVRLGKFLVVFTLVLHFFSCVWYLIACPLGKCRVGSWAEASNLNGNLEGYVTSIYWCVATLTTTGYGDVHPKTLLEMWFAILVMITGKLLFGMILANIASTLANQESQRVNYDQKLKTVQSHMSDQNVPLHLQERVIKYFNYLWIRNKGNDVKSLFKDAPFSLRAEILLHVTRDMLESIPLFESADESFMRQIAQRVGQILFLPGDYIAIKGDMGKEMYYIHRGEVEVVNEEDPNDVVSTLSQGDIFGEVSLVLCIPRRVTIRAKSYVDLFTLAKADLDEVMKLFPEIMSEIGSQGKERFGRALDVRCAEKRFSVGSHRSDASNLDQLKYDIKRSSIGSYQEEKRPSVGSYREGK